MRLALRLTNRSVFHWPVNRLSVWEKRVKRSRRVCLQALGTLSLPSPRDFFHLFPKQRDCSQANILQQQTDFAFKKLYLEEKTFFYKASVFTELSCG